MKKAKNFPEYRAHKWMTEIFDRRMPEWAKETKELEKRLGLERTRGFFQLLERNPEYIKTDLETARIMKWRFTIQMNRLYCLEKDTL